MIERRIQDIWQVVSRQNLLVTFVTYRLILLLVMLAHYTLATFSMLCIS